MKGLYLGLVFLVSVVVWRAEFVSSAVIDPNNGRGSPLGKVDPQDSIKTIENAMTEYVELAEAYYAPAPSEAVREKRTLAVFRTIANTTRAGLSAVTGLFRGNSGSGSSSGGFRAFFSDLFTRLLTFFTRLWDRITGLFNGGSSNGGSGGGFFSRLRTGASGFFARLTGGGRGGGGLFGRTTTTEAYFPDFVYTTERTTTTTTTTTEKSVENDVGTDSDFPFLASSDSKTSGSSSEAVGSSSDREGKEIAGSDVSAAGEGSYSDTDFIPFPGESEADFGVRANKPDPAPGTVLASARVDREAKPHVVDSPTVPHLLDGQRVVVV